MPAQSDPTTGRATAGSLVHPINYYALREEARNAQAQQVKRIALTVLASGSCIMRMLEWMLQQLHSDWSSVAQRPSRP